jgi:hypothetical protein
LVCPPDVGLLGSLDLPVGLPAARPALYTLHRRHSTPSKLSPTTGSRAIRPPWRLLTKAGAAPRNRATLALLLLAIGRAARSLVGPAGMFDRKVACDGEWGRIPSLEVVMRSPEVFVRPLSHQEAVRLKRMSTRAEHQSTRIRAAILLASNVRTPVPQIARMWLTDESHVRKVIHEFQRGRI